MSTLQSPPPEMTSTQDDSYETHARPEPSIGHLLRDLRDETSTLLKQEAALIRSEVSQKVKQAAIDAAKVPAGALIAYAGAVLVLIGISCLLAYALSAAGVPTLLAAFLGFTVIGAIAGGVGFALAKKSASRLAHEDVTPHETIQSARENARWAKEKI